MRKCRYAVKEVETELHAKYVTDPGLIFKSLETLELPIPTWAQFCLCYVVKTRPKIDVTFFEDPQDFFVWYSKVLIVLPERAALAAFVHEEDIWKSFSPPTLIGLNIKTRLR